MPILNKIQSLKMVILLMCLLITIGIIANIIVYIFGIVSCYKVTARSIFYLQLRLRYVLDMLIIRIIYN